MQWTIRDAQPKDVEGVNALFASQSFPLVEGAEGVRLAEGTDGALLGAIFVERAPDGTDNVKTIVIDEASRGLGVGAALMQDALGTHPDLRLVSRGVSVGFYERIGFLRCTWDDIDPIYRQGCDECPDLPTCGPTPFRSAVAR